MHMYELNPECYSTYQQIVIISCPEFTGNILQMLKGITMSWYNEETHSSSAAEYLRLSLTT